MTGDMSKKKDDGAKQFWKFVYDDGTEKEIEIGKVTVCKMDTWKVLMHLDRLPDGKHLVIYMQEVMPDGKKLERIDVRREIGGS